MLYHWTFPSKIYKAVMFRENGAVAEGLLEAVEMMAWVSIFSRRHNDGMKTNLHPCFYVQQSTVLYLLHTV